jgi:hypothetical protein
VSEEQINRPIVREGEETSKRTLVPWIPSKGCPEEWQNTELLFLLFQPTCYSQTGSVYREIILPLKTRETTHLAFFEKNVLVICDCLNLTI